MMETINNRGGTFSMSQTFIVIARFKAGTDMREVFAVVKEEQDQVAVLTAEGRLGSIHLSLERQTVFLEAFADSIEGATAVIQSLPMSKWWDLDVYPTSLPASRQ